jgi:hypothetical protein
MDILIKIRVNLVFYVMAELGNLNIGLGGYFRLFS